MASASVTSIWRHSRFVRSCLNFENAAGRRRRRRRPSVGIMRLMDRGKPCARAATTPTKIPTTWNRQGCHPSCLACGRGCGTIFSLDCVYQSKHQQLLNNSWDFVSVYFKERGREGAGSFLHPSIPSSRVASVVWFSSSLSLSLPLLSFSRAPDFSSRPIQ